MSLLDKLFPSVGNAGEKLKKYFTATAIFQGATTALLFLLFLRTFKITRK